jgi:hypothetical protein
VSGRGGRSTSIASGFSPVTGGGAGECSLDLPSVRTRLTTSGLLIPSRDALEEEPADDEVPLTTWARGADGGAGDAEEALAADDPVAVV